MELQRGGPLARAAMPLRIRSTGLMTGYDELKSGRRLYLLNLILLTGMGLTLCLCLAASSFSLKVEATKAVLTLPVLAVAGLSLLSIKRKWGARLGFVSLAIGQFGFISMFAAPLTYVAAAANLPLQDANLAYLDRLLGLDWPAYFSYATLHPVLLDYASVVYFAICVDAIAGAAVALAAIEVTKAMSACSGIVREENLSASCLALRPEPRNLLQKWVESITRVGGWTMKKSRFTEEQIIAILREQEAGAATADVCRKHGVSSATFYKWKAKYGGLEVSDAKRTHTEYDRSDALKAMH